MDFSRNLIILLVYGVPEISLADSPVEDVRSSEESKIVISVMDATITSAIEIMIGIDVASKKN